MKIARAAGGHKKIMLTKLGGGGGGNRIDRSLQRKTNKSR